MIGPKPGAAKQLLASACRWRHTTAESRVRARSEATLKTSRSTQGGDVAVRSSATHRSMPGRSRSARPTGGIPGTGEGLRVAVGRDHRHAATPLSRAPIPSQSYIEVADKADSTSFVHVEVRLKYSTLGASGELSERIHSRTSPKAVLLPGACRRPMLGEHVTSGAVRVDVRSRTKEDIPRLHRCGLPIFTRLIQTPSI
jgi:hypothetical protein